MIHHPILRQLADSGIKLGLDDVRGFLQAQGEPHRAYPVVHIAGTNGKGSTSTMVTAALVDAGYTVGTNLSPHLEAVNERVCINGIPLDDGSLTEAIEALDRARNDWARSQGRRDSPLTYFEFLTCLAFQVFAERGVDVAVVEVGLGGRLDATNIVHPQVTAITQIGLDHMDVLGNTIEAIAGEKAGIMKPGVPMIVGSMPRPARDVIETLATRMGAPCWLPGRHLSRENARSGWRVGTPDGTVERLTLSMPGEHQGSNAMVALGILHALRRQGFHIPDEAIRSGLERARIAGRLDEVKEHLWVDGAHNVDASKALARWLARREKPESRILLFGMGSTRDPRAILEPLVPYIDKVVATHCAHPKARKSHELAALLQDMDIILSDGGPIEEALPEVYAEAHETLAMGSLFLAGAVRSLVGDGVLDGIIAGQGVGDVVGEADET